MSDLVQSDKTVAVITHVGRVRKQNQDSVVFLQQDHSPCVLAIVADGMGGHQGGATASATVVSVLRDAWNTRWQTTGMAPDIDWLSLHVEVADHAVREQAAADPGLKGMGTTVVACLFDGAQLSLVHAGDSRAYCYTGVEFRRMTCDHTVVQRMVDEGLMTEVEAEQSPMKHYLTRSLGGSEVPSKPDKQHWPVKAGNRVLLCSDGLTGMVSDSEIAAMLSACDDDVLAAGNLLDKVLARGAHDNVSIVLFTV